ncbi:MAG: PIN domain-containing protein [Gammaproteobacteria bacterium]
MMFLLDTNILIYFFRGQGKVAEKLLATRPLELAITSVTLFELETGLRKSVQAKSRRRQLDAFAAAAQVWSFDQPAAVAAAEVRAALESKGRPIGTLDTLIAGIALAHRATVVTHNVGEFSRVPNLETVDWYD